MIIYWDSLEKSAVDPALIQEYIASSYFGGTQRDRSFAYYPVNPAYGTKIYKSDIKQFMGFKEDAGWIVLG